MGRIKVKTKGGRQYVTVALQKKQEINVREVETLNQGIYTELFPVQIAGRQFRYDVTGCISLKQRLQGMVSKNEFLDMTEAYLGLLRHSEEALMYLNKFLLDTDYIFYCPSLEKKLKFIYLPVMSLENTVYMQDIFREFPYRIIFNDREGLDYVRTYMNYFKNVVNFSLYDFETMIERLRTENDPGQKQAVENDCGKENKSIFYDPRGGDRVEADAKRHERDDIVVTRSFREDTIVLEDDEDENCTVRLVGGMTCAVLRRRRNGEIVRIDKNIFRIGKGKGMDYRVSGNDAISRKHAELAKRDGRYFVRDLESANKTYVDGVRVAGDEERELCDGQLLKLADEEFEFFTQYLEES